MSESNSASHSGSLLHICRWRSWNLVTPCLQWHLGLRGGGCCPKIWQAKGKKCYTDNTASCTIFFRACAHSVQSCQVCLKCWALLTVSSLHSKHCVSSVFRPTWHLYARETLTEWRSTGFSLWEWDCVCWPLNPCHINPICQHSSTFLQLSVQRNWEQMTAGWKPAELFICRKDRFYCDGQALLSTLLPCGLLTCLPRDEIWKNKGFYHLWDAFRVLQSPAAATNTPTFSIAWGV